MGEVSQQVLDLEEKLEALKEEIKGLKELEHFYVCVSLNDCQEALKNINHEFPDFVGSMSDEGGPEIAVRIKTNKIAIWSGNRGFDVPVSEVYNKLKKYDD